MTSSHHQYLKINNKNLYKMILQNALYFFITQGFNHMKSMMIFYFFSTILTLLHTITSYTYILHKAENWVILLAFNFRKFYNIYSK